MKSKFYFSFFTICFGLIILTSCSFFGRRGLKVCQLRDKKQKVAVLDFKQNGFLESNQIGGYCADQLTYELFIQKRMPVVDRSVVMSKMKAKGYSSFEINKDEIKQASFELEAGRLILGTLYRMNDEIGDAIEEEKDVIQITFRIIDALNGSVVGIVSKESSVRASLRETVKEMIEEMAGLVKL